MVLIKSISGIRGTLENIPGESLSDFDIMQFILAYANEVILKNKSRKVIVGRDARVSGNHISSLVQHNHEYHYSEKQSHLLKIHLNKHFYLIHILEVD